MRQFTNISQIRPLIQGHILNIIVFFFQTSLCLGCHLYTKPIHGLMRNRTEHCMIYMHYMSFFLNKTNLKKLPNSWLLDAFHSDLICSKKIIDNVFI